MIEVQVRRDHRNGQLGERADDRHDVARPVPASNGWLSCHR
jgi:hypothetical protein